MCVLGVEGSEKKWGPPTHPPEENFWNSPYYTNLAVKRSTLFIMDMAGKFPVLLSLTGNIY